jgi:hypothetical protein
MTLLGKVILGVVLGLGLALLVRPWVAGQGHARQPSKAFMVGGF